MASSDNPQWAWLGLLKWSLSYSDGTRPSNVQMMSPEDRAFLEEVMKEGIIDEGERMKYILNKLTEALETYQQGKELNNTDFDELESLMMELRDIVEQIDFARGFCAMKAVDFLLGCVQEEAVPLLIRMGCLGIMATLCQNNAPVQLEFLEKGAIRILSDLYFANEGTGTLKSKLIQSMSAVVRNHEMAESVLEQVDQGPALMEDALKVEQPESLRKRAIFFLRAFVTSDSSSRYRVRKFSSCVTYIIDEYLTIESPELRELALDLLNQILMQKISVNAILDRKTSIAHLGVEKITALRRLDGEEREYAFTELESWEMLMIQLARAIADEEEMTMLLGNQPVSDSVETLPQ
jgi:hsp70-interacting protein